MAKKTGFEKFVERQFEEDGVKIASPAATGTHRMTREERLALARSEDPVRQEPTGQGSEDPAEQEVRPVEVSSEPAAQKGRGRPALDPALKQNLVPLHFSVDIEVKRKLERLKIDTYRSSVKDLLMEAIRDLLVKYNVD